MRNGTGGTIVQVDSDDGPESVRAKAVIFNDPKSQPVLAQIDRVASSDAPY